MPLIPTPDEIAAKASVEIFSKRLLTNVHRAIVAEAIVGCALDSDWTWSSGDYASCDFRHKDGHRLEVKQSASLQSWNAKSLLESKCQFDIAERTGAWEGAIWRPQRGRNADIYVFCHHPVVNEQADHRDASQWRFFVTRADALPLQKSIRLSVLERLIDAVDFSHLGDRVKQSTETR